MSLEDGLGFAHYDPTSCKIRVFIMVGYCFLAASSVYVASKMIQREHGLRLVFTQKSVSNATGVDEFTIREQVGYIRRICKQSQGMGDRRAQD